MHELLIETGEMLVLDGWYVVIAFLIHKEPIIT